MSIQKRRLGLLPDFAAQDICKIMELVSFPIAAGLLVMGARGKALELYKEDAKKVRRLIEEMAGSDMKIFSFENKDLIGRCTGHPWGHITAARVSNLTQGKSVIIVTIYNPEECSAHYALRSVVPRANWKAVRGYL